MRTSSSVRLRKLFCGLMVVLLLLPASVFAGVKGDDRPSRSGGDSDSISGYKGHFHTDGNVGGGDRPGGGVLAGSRVRVVVVFRGMVGFSIFLHVKSITAERAGERL